jgi:putative hydrolase of the HAD superfamily
MEEDLGAGDVQVIDGAHAILSALRTRGVRTALICDTGFTPGRVVRTLLRQHGLLQHLELCVFSEEVGAPKPHARAFESALAGLGVGARGAVHVGDLRRSDVAGARAAGMASVRFRGHHDDADAGSGPNAGVIDCVAAGCSPVCARPEADVVVDAYPALWDLLAPRLSPAA